jgi:hypothetical protein
MYEDLLGRFLKDKEFELQGQLVFLRELERKFKRWQAVEGGRQVPLLRDQFMKVCRDFGAVANNSCAVRFCAKGESSIDAAMSFKWRVRVPNY